MSNNINYGKVKITDDEFHYLFCSAYTKLKKGKIEGIKMGPGVKDVIYKILGTESDEH